MGKIGTIVLFAIREVPQASTGFSPFELLYARRPRGLLDLAKEDWESRTSPHRTVTDHMEQVRDRMAQVWPIVRDHLRLAQQAQARVYNRGAQLRIFPPCNLVLVLIPMAECKFLAKWQGPYEVVDRVGDPAGSLPAYGPPVRRPRRTRILLTVLLLYTLTISSQVPAALFLLSIHAL